MTDPLIMAMLASTGLIGLVVVAVAGLKGWRDWLALQRLALDGRRAPGPDQGSPPATARIELADLKERVRKLEAIAAGVDLCFPVIPAEAGIHVCQHREERRDMGPSLRWGDVFDSEHLRT